MRTHDVMDFGAVGDGISDDTEALRSAMEAAKYGGRVILPLDKRLRITEDIPIWGVSVHAYLLSGGGVIKDFY